MTDAAKPGAEPETGPERRKPDPPPASLAKDRKGGSIEDMVRDLLGEMLPRRGS